MKPGRVISKAPHARDAAVAAAVKGAKAMPASGPSTLIAFRNENGEHYRYAVLQGAAQIRYLRQRLVQLQLIAYPEDTDGVLLVLGSLHDTATAA
jgi:hypothetical protein